MKKVVVPGIVAGAFMLAVGMAFGWLLNMVFPSVAVEYSNVALFRPWSDPLMSLYFAAPFILGIVLALIWNKTKVLIQGPTGRRGMHFGFFYWLLTISGMVITYSSFQISLVMAVSWSVSILVQAICAGIVLARLNE